MFNRLNLNGWHYEINGVRSSEDYFNYKLNDILIKDLTEGYEVEFRTSEIPEIEILKERLAAAENKVNTVEESQSEQNERLTAVEVSQGDQDDAINFLLMGDTEPEEEEGGTE